MARRLHFAATMKTTMGLLCCLLGACAAELSEGPELANAEGKADGEAAFTYTVWAGDDEIPDPWFRCDEALWCDAGISVRIDDHHVRRAAKDYFAQHPEAGEYNLQPLMIYVMYGEQGATTTLGSEHLIIKVLRDDLAADGVGRVTQRLSEDWDGDGWSFGQFERDQRIVLATYWNGDEVDAGGRTFEERAGGVVALRIWARWR
jgi:hypothetical protein